MQNRVRDILRMDEVRGILRTIEQDEPEGMIVAWWDKKTDVTKTVGFGGYPLLLGLLDILTDRIDGSGTDAEEET